MIEQTEWNKVHNEMMDEWVTKNPRPPAESGVPFIQSKRFEWAVAREKARNEILEAIPDPSGKTQPIEIPDSLRSLAAPDVPEEPKRSSTRTEAPKARGGALARLRAARRK